MNPVEIYIEFDTRGVKEKGVTSWLILKLTHRNFKME